MRGKTIHTDISNTALILKYTTFALTPHNWSCLKVTHMPGEIEGDFSAWFLHDTDRVRIPFAEESSSGYHSHPHSTTRSLRTLRTHFQTRGQRFKLWDSSFKTAVILRHGHTVGSYQARFRHLQRVQGSSSPMLLHLDSLHWREMETEFNMP